MEVHQHTHTPRKKWTHYFWEFLMLFLAVTLGFIVENLREHMTEHKKGMEYIRSWYHDLKTDTTNLSPVIVDFWRKDRGIDSLLLHFDDIKESALSEIWGVYGPELDSYTDFVFTEGTIQQLKNSGGLRLIDNSEVLDSIISYDFFTRNVEFKSENVHQAQLVVEVINNSVFDLQKIYRELAREGPSPVYAKNEFILITDKAVLGRFYNEIFRFKFICKKYLRTLEKAKAKTQGLILFLKEKYHLE